MQLSTANAVACCQVFFVIVLPGDQIKNQCSRVIICQKKVVETDTDRKEPVEKVTECLLMPTINANKFEIIIFSSED